MTDSCVTDIRARHKRNIRLTWILLILGLVVACSVAWTLRGVGITMANETVCGMEEHQHSAACYADIADGGQLICTLPEHIHTVACTGIDTANNEPPVVEITTPTEAPTEPATEPERETVQLPNYLADASASYEKNVIYVNTALGERSKDTVHEWLDLGLPGENDGKYFKNSKESPYILQVGDTVELCIYTDSSSTDTFWSAPDGAMTLVNESYTIQADGSRKVVKEYKPNQTGDMQVHFGEQKFYINVPDPKQELEAFHYDHADIEITDGGFYEIKRTVTDQNGNQVTTRQIFDSYITGVNHCYIYNAAGSVIMTYESTDYESHGTPGETQYELTSKYRCMENDKKWVKRSEVDHAQFDVQLLLKPRQQIVTVTRNGVQISQTETDISDSTGESDVTILSAVFDMSHRSVVDANNKCPDHSGLDFNLMANVNQIIKVEPASVEPTARKHLTNGSIGTNQFQFELLDKDGKLIDRQYCDTEGQVTFEAQYFLMAGTYTYTIRENIPSKAVQIDGKPYSRGIFYDSHTETVTVTVTADAQGNLSASMAYSGGSAPVFRNTAVTERYMPIGVQKVWSDSSTVDHTADAIGFRIWRIESGQPDALVSIDGKSKFYLNDASGWKWSYTELPVQYAGRTYSYRVEEVDIPDGYIAGYTSGQNDGTLEYTITNTPKDAITLSIQKQWLAPDGTPMQGAPTAQSVSALLQRQCKEVEIPVTIQVVSPAGALLEQYKQPAYVGSSFTFTLGVTEGTAENVSVVSADKCSAAYANGVFTVQDIQVGALVRVRCDNVMDSSSLLLHHTFESTFEKWESTGDAMLGGGYYTNYVAGSGPDCHSLKIYNRTQDWASAVFTLDSSVIKPGQTYSFSAYLNRAAVYTESDNSTTHNLGADHTAPLNLTLYYEDSAGGSNYLNIATVGAAPSGSWIHLRNASLTIPVGCTNMKLQVETNGEEGTDKFSDLFLDEVIIAPAGMDISVEQNTGRVLLNNPEFYSFTVTGKTIPADVQQNVDNWHLDAWNKRIEITAVEGWIKTLSGTELDQVPNRIYQYFVQEDPMTGFTPSYSDMYVSSNTAQTPIIIKNQSIAYTLPATGGVGLVPFLGGGSLLILASGLYSYKLIRRKRRSSA
ncbi:Spy0128 family protein [Ruminococcus champanellensis]|uniref:Spy0128 family protein n=1 Tax=Ruminococcus champanellensis TaxID=1161942 RepID=UPI0023F508A8|nr:FctA domain-containing protein [Ruminococcus champanellensis]